MPVSSGGRERKKYQAKRKACTRLNRSGSPRIDYISRWLLDKRTFGERVGERRERKREREKEKERVTAEKQWEGHRGKVRSVEVWWLGKLANGRKTQDLFDTWWITARENRRIFFPSPFSHSPASREKMDPANGVCRSKLLCAKIELYIVLSVYHVTSIWVLLMWEMATQEFKFRNYFRTFGVARVKPADEKGLSVDKKIKNKRKTREKISLFDQFVYRTHWIRTFLPTSYL